MPIPTYFGCICCLLLLANKEINAHRRVLKDKYIETRRGRRKTPKEKPPTHQKKNPTTKENKQQPTKKYSSVCKQVMKAKHWKNND